MKFNFKIQQYRTDAVDSVVGVFKGQPYIIVDEGICNSDSNYYRDMGV